MGYDLHIVRTEHWRDASSAPVTKADVDRMIAADESLSWSTSDYADMKEKDGSIIRYFFINWNGEPAFWWCRSEITCKNPTDDQIFKLAEMAKALGARLVGDDGEYYELGKSFFGKPKVVVRK